VSSREIAGHIYFSYLVNVNGINLYGLAQRPELLSHVYGSANDGVRALAGGPNEAREVLMDFLLILDERLRSSVPVVVRSDVQIRLIWYLPENIHE
jgi:hypothetical protein